MVLRSQMGLELYGHSVVDLGRMVAPPALVRACALVRVM